MVLGSFQSWLEEFYALDIGYDVYDFLITDERLASTLDSGGRQNEEKLLIAEDDGGAEVGLYLQRDLVDRLMRHDPTARLDEQNFADFLTAFEGVSHFMYYAFRARNDRQVTLLEMELQAEVDKFVATAELLRRQGERPPQGLHHWLFRQTKLVDELTSGEHERYARASHYAGKYCLKLWPRLADGSGWESVRQELRYFYRLARGPKIDHIEAR